MSKHLLLDVKLGGFLIQERLSRGGMGSVWRSRHIHTGVGAAIKVITADRARDPRYQQLFRQEVRAVAALEHPGVIQVFDYGTVDDEAEHRSDGNLIAGSPYLAMALSPHSALDKNPKDWPTLKETLLGTLDALAYTHARGVLHRDIKPGNILAGLQDDRLHITLIDFGLADIRSDDQQHEQMQGGTPAYMAPERIVPHWQHMQGPWSDLYAVGCLAYQLASGLLPFKGPTVGETLKAHVHQPMPALVSRYPLPSEFEDWVARLLIKNPYKRAHTTAADAAWALRQLDTTLTSESAQSDLKPILTEPSAFMRMTTYEAGTTQSLTQPGDLSTPEQPHNSALEPLPPAPFPNAWEVQAPAPSKPMQGTGLRLYGLKAVPLIGRMNERKQLWAQLTKATEHKTSRFIAIVGPAGTGKSRLARWFSEQAYELGAATLLQANHSIRTRPGEALQSMVASYGRCTHLPRHEAATHMRTLLSEDNDTTRILLDMACIAQESSQRRPASIRDRHLAVVHLTQRLTAERPLVIWLDDVQWGMDTLRFCQQLRTHTHIHPVIVVLTVQSEALATRPEEAELLDALLQHENSDRIDLEPLTQTPHNALVQHLLGLDSKLVSDIAKRTEGNPLFAVQLVGDWVQRGLLRPGVSGGFVLEPGAHVTLPDNLHQVWSTRIVQLLHDRPEHDRQALEIASLLGATINPELWYSICENAGCRPDENLAERLLEQHLARRTDQGWSFVHGMLQESLERLADESGRLEAHHRSCAHTFRTKMEQAPERGLAERLGLHLKAAKQYDDAIPALLQGAQERDTSGDFETALKLLEQQEACLDILNAPENDPRRSQGWTLKIGTLRIGVGWESARQVSLRAIAIARTLEDLEIKARVLLEHAIILHTGGMLDEALELYQETALIFEQCGSKQGWAQAIHGIGRCHHFKGSMKEADRCYDKAGAIFKAIGDDHRLSNNMIAQGWSASIQGNFASSTPIFEQAHALAVALGDRYYQMRALDGIANVMHRQGQLDKAEASYRELRQLCTAIFGPDARYGYLLDLGIVLIDAERYDEATVEIDLLEESLETLTPKTKLGLYSARLTIAAARKDATFEDHIATLEHYEQESNVTDKNMAIYTHRAGEIALKHGNLPWAIRALNLSYRTWKAIEREDQCDAIQAILESIKPDQ